MKKVKKKITNNLTRSYFDKRFDQLAQVVGKGFKKHDKKFKEHDKRFDRQDKEISDIKTGLFSVKYDVKELTSTVSEIKDSQVEMMSLLDGYVKSNEDFKEEFYIMRAEVGEIKKVIKEKLGVEISLI